MKNRIEIESQDKWNVEALYPSLEVWEEEFKRIDFSEVLRLKGRLAEGISSFKKALELIVDWERRLEKLYTYAHLRHDEDITNDKHKSAYIRITSLCCDFKETVSWFEPEILNLPEKMLQGYLGSKELTAYFFYIEKIIRLRPHTLSAEMEGLIAMSGKALSTPPKAFSALNNADLKFPLIKDAENKEHELTHGLYQMYMRSQDRKLREHAFKGLHGRFQEFENTFAELIQGQIQSHHFYAKAHRFPTCLDAALFPLNIPTSVYFSLIKSVKKALPSLHRYIALRKKVLQLPQLHLYDMSVPLVKAVDMRMDYKEAKNVVIESVAPLGDAYQSTLAKGLKSERWVDVYENTNKRSGAYSSGCYDSYPYILMNYRGIMRDVCTLAHEAGHSMHSYLSRQTQSYVDANYSIFVAEVASTFNEELLTQSILKKCTKKEERMFLINEKIEDIRATFFRQALFAEFELLLHTLVEEGAALTPTLIKEKYYQLNREYFGPDIVIDQEIAIEWARIPHFYYNFYVYQYATGISAAFALVEKVLSRNSTAQEHYLTFLKAGGSDYPINLLKKAGVDMTTPEPVEATIRKFDSLVTELEHLFLTEAPR